MNMPKQTEKKTRTTKMIALSLALATFMAGGAAHATAWKPVLQGNFVHYFEVRTITDALPGAPAPPFTYLTRRLSFDHAGIYGGRVAVSTDRYTSAGNIVLVNPTTGAIEIKAPSPDVGDMWRPTAVAIPSTIGPYLSRIYHFQQHDTADPWFGRKVFWIGAGQATSFGSVFSGTGMDAGSALTFAPASFGGYGGQLFGTDSGNSPGFTSGDGVRRWDSAGTWTNEVMGPTANNPDSYVDLTFTGPQFGAFSHRLLVANTTGVGGENIIGWSDATLAANDALGAYNAREVLSTSAGLSGPVKHITYGAYASKGVVYGEAHTDTYRFDSAGNSKLFMKGGFNDLEFGTGRRLFVADLYDGLHEVKPSPLAFAHFLRGRRCDAAHDFVDDVLSWQVGGTCAGYLALCRLASRGSCEDCLSPAEAEIVNEAVEAICGKPCP
jgi:hypothetical protein